MPRAPATPTGRTRTRSAGGRGHEVDEPLDRGDERLVEIAPALDPAQQLPPEGRGIADPERGADPRLPRRSAGDVGPGVDAGGPGADRGPDVDERRAEHEHVRISHVLGDARLLA